MNSWREDIFNNFIKLNRGFDLPNAKIKDGIYPVIASTSIKAYHNQYKVKSPCVVTGRSGSLGTIQFVSTDAWPLNTALYVKDFKGNNPKFVYYFLQQMHLENFNSGAGVPTLNQNHLHKLKVNIPNLPIQRKIAAILSAYDDLIENNNKRISILENMAEQIYKEWFVRMRFPNYKNTKFVKGIPDGWEVKKLTDEINLLMGQSPKSKFYNTEKKGLPFNQGVGTYGERFPRKEIFCNTKGRMANEGDILFSVRAPVGRLNIADTKMIIGRGLSAMRHKKDFQSFLYYLLKNYFDNEDLIGNGSIFNSVGKDELSKFKVLIPSEHFLRSFEKIVTPIDDEIKTLIFVNENLTKTRDSLLPRLLSGKLSVENLDIKFPPSMENDNA